MGEREIGGREDWSIRGSRIPYGDMAGDGHIGGRVAGTREKAAAGEKTSRLIVWGVHLWEVGVLDRIC